MTKFLKRVLLFLFACSELLMITSCKQDDSKKPTTPKPEVVVDMEDSLTAMQLAKAMQMGWNLGNTLDAISFWPWEGKTFPYNEGLESETSWGELKTTKAIIEAGIKNGYKTIRIPVTWSNHLTSTKYVIDSAWLERVQQVVDWAIEAGYYVILNEHHSVHGYISDTLQKCEGYIIRNTPEDIAESKAFLENIWTQICQTFNNGYDEHLIFETMNEPNNRTHDHAWYAYSQTSCEECVADLKLINEYNQLIVDTIRASGGNNAKRFIMIPGSSTSTNAPLMESFKLPTDTAKDRLIVTVHTYPMGLDEGESFITHFTDEVKNTISWELGQLNEKFAAKGIPVVIGEFGIAKKNKLNGSKANYSGSESNYDDRLACFKYVTELAGKYTMPLINWDAGGSQDDSMATINRTTCKPWEPEYLAAGIAAWKAGNEEVE